MHPRNSNQGGNQGPGREYILSRIAFRAPYPDPGDLGTKFDVLQELEGLPSALQACLASWLSGSLFQLTSARITLLTPVSRGGIVRSRSSLRRPGSRERSGEERSPMHLGLDPGSQAARMVPPEIPRSRPLERRPIR